MVVLTAAGGYFLGCLRSGISPFSINLVQALFGIALVTAGSSALNQAFERVTDRRMPRTAQRPMAQHRIGLASGLITGFILTFFGSLYLVWTTNLLTGTLTLLTAVSYVGIYTPLKRITRLNTFIGAFPGAAASAHRLDRRAWRHRVACHRALRHSLRLAVPALHGHRLDVPERLRQGRHPRHRNTATCRARGTEFGRSGAASTPC